MKKYYFPFLIILLMLPMISAADPIDKIAALIKQGNTSELAKAFAANVEIAILADENVYSKAQAELILNKFFSQNKPTAVKILHRVNSNQNYRFGVLIVTTDKGIYRVAVTIKDESIIELRIETEKVK